MMMQTGFTPEQLLEAAEWREAAIRARLEAERRKPRPRDTFVLPGEGPYVTAHRRLEALVLEIAERDWRWTAYTDIRGFACAEPILQATPGERADVAVAAMHRVAWYLLRQDSAWERNCVDSLLEVVTALPLEFTPEGMADLLEAVAALPRGWPWLMLRSGHVLSHLERVWSAEGAAGVLRPMVQPLCDRLRASPEPEARPMAERLFVLLHGADAVYLEDDPWSTRVLAAIEAMEPAERERWTALLRFLQSAGSKASPKWLKQARAAVATVGADAFRTQAAAWLDAIAPGADTLLPVRAGDLARGMVWALAGDPDAETAGVLGGVALACGRKIPMVGQRSAKVVNACVAALGEMPGMEALEQIGRLRAKIRYVQAQALIEKTLLAAAARRGMQPADLEELAVSTFGMEEPGLIRDDLDGWTVEVRLDGGKAETAWTRDGKTQKSPPAALKSSHADELKALKKAATEMEQAFSAQRARLETIPMWERTLPFPAWRERYLDHPLMALLARRIIWRFESDGEVRPGAWLGGALVDADDRPLEGLGDGTMAGLWHPVAAAPEDARAWRAWLDRHAVTQPFKQAHRETYRLTPAEEETFTYSNRFAAHVLRQHQMAALAKSRGWQSAMMGEYDGGMWPTLRIPGHAGLTAEFWIEGVEGEAMMAHSGVAMYVATDSVRFFRDGVPLPLEQVPPLVLSEVMRDVDLFVGVSSIGTDPQWRDGEGLGRYWRDFAFGVLSATAETRREVLERLLPRLKIAPVARLEDRFLEVRGTLATYRIHLGSGNVLMEPGSRYLCIVPDSRAQKNRVAAPALPFEGDTLLSVILSKAFLLADDTRITDPTIIRQIRAS
ncbi:DUF4132 domain-containing protein [Longimicrobium sp.]|uniref:DUF4132 domain-containing protein n=1 Tax=Longimicrobium sp. TaxID=2029185 RepID=UPI002CB36A69|nr:DUF4132 domain-containing protein [Longimicrobium sp.]HSU16830.1 DUF4132 domain-containing protein [Longimicrobium sp.]